MRFRFFSQFSVRLFDFLLTLLPTSVFCQRQSSQLFAVADSWPKYCPGPEDAISACYARSRLECAAECLSRQWCIYFSYYASSGMCHFYRFLSPKIFYDHDCTFMMVSIQNLISLQVYSSLFKDAKPFNQNNQTKNIFPHKAFHSRFLRGRLHNCNLPEKDYLTFISRMLLVKSYKAIQFFCVAYVCSVCLLLSQ